MSDINDYMLTIWNDDGPGPAQPLPADFVIGRVVGKQTNGKDILKVVFSPQIDQRIEANAND